MRGWSLIAVVACACSGKPTTPPPVENAGSGASAASVTLRVEGTSGHALLVDNPSDAPVRLQRDILVEHHVGDAWERVEAGSRMLRETCDVVNGGLYEPPACVEIAAHSLFRAEPWTDEIGDSQGACEECGPVETGSYRMVVIGCDGGPRLETAPFDVSGR